MSFEPWMLALADDTGSFGIRDEHVEKVAEKLLDMKRYEIEITQTGKIDIDYPAFCTACRECGIEPDNFKQEDLDKLQRRLNEQ